MQGQERDDEGEESYFMKGRGQNHGWEGWAGAGSQRGWGPWGWMAEAEGRERQGSEDRPWRTPERLDQQ